MVFSTPQSSRPVSVHEIVRNALQVEQSHDTSAVEEILSPIWKDLSAEPDFSEFPELDRAGLYRVAGYALSVKGQAKGDDVLKSCGQRYFSKALKIFRDLKKIDKAYEASIMVAFALIQDNKYSAADEKLIKCATHYKNQKRHHNYLLAQTNRLVCMFYKAEYDLGMQCAEETYPYIEHCSDPKIKFQFHNNSGIIYRKLNQPDKAEQSYEKTFEYAKELENQRFITLALNNLAMLNKDLRNFPKAIELIDQALKISRKHDNYIWCGHFSDTEAQIHYAAEDYPQALKAIEKSVFYFRHGKESAGMISASWLKVKILVALDQETKART